MMSSSGDSKFLFLRAKFGNLQAPSVVNSEQVTPAATHWPVPFYQAERIKTQAVLYRLRKKITEDLPECNYQKGDCEQCRQEECHAAERLFVSRKLQMLSKEALGDKLEEHLIQKDSITLLGEVINNCVPPFASSEEIWKAIKKRTEERVLHKRQHTT